HFITVIIGSAIIFATIAVQIALFAAKLDGFLNTISVSVLVIPVYVIYGTICLTGYVIGGIFCSERAWYMLYPLVTSVVAYGIPAPWVCFFILVSLKLDLNAQWGWTMTFIPFYVMMFIICLSVAVIGCIFGIL